MAGKWAACRRVVPPSRPAAIRPVSPARRSTASKFLPIGFASCRLCRQQRPRTPRRCPPGCSRSSQTVSAAASRPPLAPPAASAAAAVWQLRGTHGRSLASCAGEGDGPAVDYFAAKHILAQLAGTAEKGLLGGYKGEAGKWDKIVRAYEANRERLRRQGPWALPPSRPACSSPPAIEPPQRRRWPTDVEPIAAAAAAQCCGWPRRRRQWLGAMTMTLPAAGSRRSVHSSSWPTWRRGEPTPSRALPPPPPSTSRRAGGAARQRGRLPAARPAAGPTARLAARPTGCMSRQPASEEPSRSPPCRSALVRALCAVPTGHAGLR